MYKLRELEKKDLISINSWRNDKEIISNLGAPFRFINQEVDEKWYDNYMQSRFNTIRCAITKNDNDDIIGLISLTNIDYINRNAVLHLMIGSNFQGCGAGTFAINEMLNHAFNDYGLKRIELEVLSNNKRAIHVYEKCGFVKEGTKQKAVFKNGEFLDMHIYACLNNSYPLDKKQNLCGGGV